MLSANGDSTCSAAPGRGPFSLCGREQAFACVVCAGAINNGECDDTNILKISAASVVILCALSMPSIASDAGQAYIKSMEKMSVDMKKGMDPDATKAWAKMMVAHYQGAIEMSQTVLKETKDPQIREMAEKAAVKDQTKEQTMLKEWIGKHGG